MRPRKNNNRSEMIHVDLVPFMDVILTVLVFFILASLSLTRQQGVVNVTLPSTDSGVTQETTPDPLVVGLNQQRQVLLENQAINETQLNQRMQSYLTSNPKGAVILKADRQLPYEQVVQVLSRMRAVGGDRVSLAIDQS